MSIKLAAFLEQLEAICATKPDYRIGGSGTDGTCDCIWYGTDCSVVEIQDAIEDAKNAADLLRRIQKMKLLKKVALDRETEQRVRFKTTDCWGNISYLEIRK